METTTKLMCCPAQAMDKIHDVSVDLVLTSPPYPMIEMWDEIFTQQNEKVGTSLNQGDGTAAFSLMHELLDTAWDECDRVLKPGGIACINIGDATRTIDGDFQLYSNHSRILSSFLSREFAALPDVLWRKQTNSPNSFMGSGMLPVGAYVTYEHEYILVMRKGRRREFLSAEEKSRRRSSAFFWEERNVWFSDVWFDIKGTVQGLADTTARNRSGAFPFELAHRLICMFSIKGDVVLDPFVGTGTTLAAALATGRNSIGVELDDTLLALVQEYLPRVKDEINKYNRSRLAKHVAWATLRTSEKGPLKHVNRHYGFPVMTGQEKELLINDVEEVSEWSGELLLTTRYDDMPQTDYVQHGEFSVGSNTEPLIRSVVPSRQADSVQTDLQL